MPGYNNMLVSLGRKSLTGSITETQETLDFCAQHGITPEIELIST
jgi:alcohol dehydrogenase (NADP+)